MSSSGSDHSPLYLGFDLSTQQLKGLVVDSQLQHKYHARVDFDGDCSDVYGVEKGTLTNPDEGEVYAPVAMWLKAIDLVLSRLKHQGLDFSRVAGVSGAGMQHGSVFWSFQGEHDLGALSPRKPLEAQLKDAFAWPYSPNWQDASTQEECDAFDAELKGKDNIEESRQELANRTGSKAHHRFTGPQIMRLRKKQPEAYEKTARISLVSSWLASIFLGKIAPIDHSDVCGMNLWDIPGNKYNDALMSLASGGDPEGLERKLHQPCAVEGTLGPVSSYFVKRWGFPETCQIAPSTGDNPSTILSLPLGPNDAMVSLGTSTTFLMSTTSYVPDPSYHFFNHPTTKGLYMFMLCYKNGGLAREKVRNSINIELNAPDKSWDAFNDKAVQGSVLGMDRKGDPAHIGLYFPRPEIVPNVPAGTRRFQWDYKNKELKKVVEDETHAYRGSRSSSADASLSEPSDDEKQAKAPPGYFTHTDPRAILESQFLSLRLRSRNLVSRPTAERSKWIPPQPRRVYLVGGGSVNPAIVDIAQQVLGGYEGVYRLDVGGDACALGAAYRAAWAVEEGAKKEEHKGFEEFLKERWDEDKFVKKVGMGYIKNVWEAYDIGLEALQAAEEQAIKDTAHMRGEN